MEMEFFRCDTCGNIITIIKKSGAPVSCCGQTMTKLIAGSSDGAFEKHVPVVSVDGNKVTVKVGEVEHPMIDAHYIEWICIQTSTGSAFKYLKPEQKPEAVFTLADGEDFECAYAFCNLHGLWKSK